MNKFSFDNFGLDIDIIYIYIGFMLLVYKICELISKPMGFIFDFLIKYYIYI